MRRMTLAVLLVALVAAGGCGSEDPFNQPRRQVQPEAFGVSVEQGTPVAPPPPPATTSTEAAPASDQAVPPPPPAAADAQAPQTPPPPQPPASGEPEAAETSPPPAENMVRQEAKVGVGKRGRGYQPGLITTPVAAYFGARERIVFEIQIPQAMKLYKAFNGQGPKSQEEFMQKIIKENQIKLPDLPPGHRYVYDPQTEQLMVERPQ